MTQLLNTHDIHFPDPVLIECDEDAEPGEYPVRSRDPAQHRQPERLRHYHFMLHVDRHRLYYDSTTANHLETTQPRQQLLRSHEMNATVQLTTREQRHKPRHRRKILRVSASPHPSTVSHTPSHLGKHLDLLASYTREITQALSGVAHTQVPDLAREHSVVGLYVQHMRTGYMYFCVCV